MIREPVVIPRSKPMSFDPNPVDSPVEYSTSISSFGISMNSFPAFSSQYIGKKPSIFFRFLVRSAIGGGVPPASWLPRPCAAAGMLKSEAAIVTMVKRTAVRQLRAVNTRPPDSAWGPGCAARVLLRGAFTQRGLSAVFPSGRCVDVPAHRHRHEDAQGWVPHVPNQLDLRLLDPQHVERRLLAAPSE